MNVIIGYHGCDKVTAQLLLGGSPFKVSQNEFDWLGDGAYFWEGDLVRAYEWAKEFRKDQASVVGAVIDLNNCLDLTTQSGIRAVEGAYLSYSNLQKLSNKELISNKDVKDRPSGNLALRYLDRAVITHLHETSRAAKIAPYDTVRALFPEGEQLYTGAGFWKKTHLQIAVKTINHCIRGVFRVPRHDLEHYRIPEDVYAF